MNGPRSLRLALLAGTIGTLGAGTAGADPVVRTSATVTAGVAYERNPFLIATPNSTDAASAQVEVRPRVDIIDQKTQATVSGFYNRSQYFTKYQGNDGAGVSANAVSQLSPRWTVNAGTAFESTVLGANNGFGAFQDALSTLPPTTTPGGGAGTGVDTGTGASGTTPTTGTGTGAGTTVGGGDITTPVATLPGVDIGLIGLRQRRNALTSTVGATYQPDSRSTWTASGYAERSWYPGDRTILAQNYRTLGGSLGYNRSLSETTSVGVRGSASFTKYDRNSKSSIYSPQVTFNRRFARNWTLDLAAGASIIDTSGALIGSTRGTTVNVQGSLCHADVVESFCLSAARAPSVSGFSGVTTLTSVSASYTRRLDERSSLSASASFSHNTYGNDGQFLNVAPLNSQNFWGGTVSYSRRLTQRLSAVGTAGYRDVSYGDTTVNSLNLGSPRADISGRIGLSVALGRLQ